jgi:hypothetical protein
MKTKPLSAFILPCALASAALSAATPLLSADIVFDSFDYPSEVVELPAKKSDTPLEFASGSGWEPAPRGQWTFGLWGNVADHGGQVTYQMAHPESLKAPGTLAKLYQSTGGRFANVDTDLNITAWRRIDVEGGPLSYASLPASTGPENVGRSEAGIGAAGKTIWLSALMVPGEEPFGVWLKLANLAYGTMSANGGLVFHVDGSSSKLFVQQDWTVLNKVRKDTPGRIEEFVSIQPDEPFLLVAKIQFGPNWGGDTPFATKDANSFDPENTPTDGKVTVWINPDLTKEPSESAASAKVNIFEFRFSAVGVRLAPGAAVDELRLAPTFEQLLLK